MTITPASEAIMDACAAGGPVFVAETLYTDTVVWEVVGHTAKSITIRRTAVGDVILRENRDDNPYPCVYSEAVSVPGAPTKVVRLRKDGTFRTGRGANPLRLARRIDGRPVSFTDYRN